MAATVTPEPTTNGVSAARLGELQWLDTPHTIYEAQEKAWRREERRLYGGDAVLEELTRFDGESTPSFEDRQKKASYVNLPLAHARAITGELSRKRPTLGKGLFLGKLGEVRPRSKLQGRLSFAELFYYNVDGVGQDGSEFPAFMDAVDERAQATGHRWLMVESPQGAGGLLPLRDVLDGQRPYVVEYSPLDVTNWSIVRGRLQFAVIRTPAEEARVTEGEFVGENENGYYLLVRKGYDRLGPAFAGGGWWLFDKDKNLIDARPWAYASGDIPMWIHYGQRSHGTQEHPALSRSSTMELGQIAVALMDATSARYYDFWDACSSHLYFLGATPDIMAAIAQQAEKRSMLIGVPHATGPEGELKPITVHDGSMGAVSADVAKSVIDALFQEAREQSFQQITSTPDSSGASKEAGHAENKAPILAMRARERQQSENTLLHFVELRFGISEPTASSEWPTDFDLAPLVEAVDEAFDMLRRSKLRSRTAEIQMALTSLEERGIVNEENRATIKAELEASFDQGEADAEAAREAAKSLAGEFNTGGQLT